MIRTRTHAVMLAAICLPGIAAAQGVDAIFDKARELQQSRSEGLAAYVVERSTMGQTVSIWQVRAFFETDDGGRDSMFVPMGQQQLHAKLCDSNAMSAEGLEAHATASEWAGDALATEVEKGMDEAGLPKGMLAATGDEPWNTMNPRVMMGGNAQFLRAAAQAQRDNEAYDPGDDARNSYDQMTQFVKNAKLVGSETVDGRPAFHIRATGVDQVHRGDDGSEFRIDSVDMLIDSEHYVPLKMAMQGSVTHNGESRPMTMENLHSDYRNVPGSDLYESYRQVTRMSGMLSPEQQVQMQEAQAQMADYEKQLEAMSPRDRAMVESMMGDKIEQFRNLASGNAFEIEMAVKSIRPVAELTPTEIGCNENPFSRAGGGQPAGDAGIAPMLPQRSPEALQAAQQACLQEKLAATQAAQKKKRGFGRLLSGVSRIAGQSGNYDLSRKTHDIYQAGAAAEDFSQAAKDLGLSEDDLEACQYPD